MFAEFKEFEEFEEYQRKFNSAKNIARIKDCYYLSENNIQCKNKEIIKAHSIQNNKILSKIAADGMCISPKAIEFDFKEIGRKVASTFTGFCKEHDKNLFMSIEDNDYVEGNREQEFLFAYRAAAKQFYTDRHMFATLEEVKKQYNDNEMTVSIENLKKKMEIDIKDGERTRYQFNNNLRNKRFDRISTIRIVLDSEYPIALSAAGSLQFDLERNQINQVYGDGYIATSFHTCFPQNGKTYFLMSYLSKDKARFEGLVQQINAVTQGKDVEKIKLLLSNLILLYAENFYLGPDLWNKFSDKEKKDIVKYFQPTPENMPYRYLDLQIVNLFRD